VASVVVLIIVSAWVRRVPGLGAASPLVVVGAGVLDVSANALYLLAVHGGLLSIVAVLVSLYPVGTVLCSMVVLGERLRAPQIAARRGRAGSGRLHHCGLRRAPRSRSLRVRARHEIERGVLTCAAGRTRQSGDGMLCAAEGNDRPGRRGRVQPDGTRVSGGGRGGRRTRA